MTAVLPSHSFADRIESIQKSDRQKRIMNSSVFDFAEYLYQTAHICPIKSFNWLCSLTVKTHEHAGQSFVEFIIPDNLKHTHSHLIYFFKNAAIGMWALKHFKSAAAFIRSPQGHPDWCYPLDLIRDLPPDDSRGEVVKKSTLWDNQNVLL